MLFGPRLKKYLFEKPFSGTAAALEAQKARNLRAFSGLGIFTCLKGLFLALARPWKPKRLVIYVLWGPPLPVSV